MGDKNNKCYLCGKTKVEIEYHHVIPKFWAKHFSRWEGTGGTVPLCERCHKRLHSLLAIWEQAISEEEASRKSK